MLSYHLLRNIKNIAGESVSTRNIGLLAPCFQKASDPVQQLFLDKLREYKQKSGSGNKLVEPSPEIEKELKADLDRVAKIYGGDAGVDLTKFPQLKFPDPAIDPINLEK